MISSVRGIVLAVAGTSAVIEVGGIGLAVQVTPQHGLSLRVGSEATVRTALIVREDDLSLFGFESDDGLAVFDHLRSVTGVGPKSAMGVLAAMTPAEIARAVTLEDDAAFRKVSGIGPKTAKLIVVSLAGKLAFVAPAAATSAAPASVTQNVIVALVGLGWPERTAMQAVDDAVANASPAEANAVPALLRLALANLGPQQFAGSSS
ncbi:Holliday junction branch migration protein RuvA [soil metagenome]